MNCLLFTGELIVNFHRKFRNRVFARECSAIVTHEKHRLHVSHPTLGKIIVVSGGPTEGIIEQQCNYR